MAGSTTYQYLYFACVHEYLTVLLADEQHIYSPQALSVRHAHHRAGDHHSSRKAAHGEAVRRVSCLCNSLHQLTGRIGRAETFILVTILYVLGYVSLLLHQSRLKLTVRSSSRLRIISIKLRWVRSSMRLGIPGCKYCSRSSSRT
jgi:hypothetical protein